MAEARFVSLKDPFKEEVERLKKSVTRYEEFLVKTWRERKVYDAATAFEVRPRAAENIVGVGVGEQVTAGKPTGRMCVKVYVAEKVPEEEVEQAFVVPEEIEGETVDVEAVGLLEALPHTRRYRPVPGGVSISYVSPPCIAGTLGCFCSSDEPREPILILSNNHVLVKPCNSGRPGDPIIQPGCADGGADPRDRIATLFDFEPIDFTGRPNLVDAALAKPINREVVTLEILRIGKVRGAAPPVLGTQVKKSGRTTQLTAGVITGVGATVVINYPGCGRALFRDQVIITPGTFSRPGDSGSAILDTRNRVRALLFAGSETHTVANPIQNVISELSTTPRPIKGLRILDC